jgi:hypothetical protein
MKLSYVSAVLFGLAAGVASWFFVESIKLAKSREEMTQFLQLADKIQAQLPSKRQQLQSQQERLARGSAISQTVGPAVVADIFAAAEKGSNVRLRDLLQQHSVRQAQASGKLETAAKEGGN